MNKYFDMSDKVFDVTTKYPDLIDLFVAAGFENLKNNMLRKTIGKTISVEMALKSKKIDVKSFEKQMIEVIESNNYELSSGLVETKKNNKNANTRIVGILPCPVRIQMLDKIENWLSENGEKINYELKSASMGTEWMKEEIEKAKDYDELADIYLSTGFSLFFDKKLMGKYIDSNIFGGIEYRSEYNKIFQNEKIDLRDPKKIYNIVGAVPIVFTVNTELLGDRPFPKGWKDLLNQDFENSIAVPMGDLDMFNAFILGIYNIAGKEGVARFGKGTMSSMHPSEMVKSTKKHDKAPIITIMPYFFSFTIDKNSPMKVVWPKEGALLSPIFFICKRENNESTKKLIEFLLSKEMAEIMSQDGKFPSTHKELDNHIDEDKKFLWVDWKLLLDNDVAGLLEELTDIFYKGEI